MNVKAYFDGCCEPKNPGGTASYGVVVLIDGKRKWEKSEIFHPEKGKENETSNNVAEYSGFIAILKYLVTNGLDKIPVTIYGDSQLVLYQMFGDHVRKKKWKIKKGYYVPLAKEAKQLLYHLGYVKGQWIPREENTIADELSKAKLIKAGVEFKIQPE